MEALAQFARRLSLDATWGDLQQLMLQVHQASAHTDLVHAISQRGPVTTWPAVVVHVLLMGLAGMFLRITAVQF